MPPRSFQSSAYRRLLAPMAFFCLPFVPTAFQGETHATTAPDASAVVVPGPTDVPGLPGEAGCNVAPGTESARFAGIVSDAAGALVPAAQVTVRCGSFSRRIQTDASGHFSLRLPVGSYQVFADATGFATGEQNVLITRDGFEAFDIHLAVASASNAVTVHADNDYVPTVAASATKTSTPLTETPQSISVIPAAELAARDTQTVAETLRYTAGVDAEPYGADTRLDWFFIRGFSMTTDGLFLDGLALPKIYNIDASWTTNPYSLGQVDVIKGPASVLYGQNEPGGLVELETKRPPAEAIHELSFEGGDFSRLQGSFDFGGPLKFGGLGQSGHWLYRLTGRVRSSESQVQFAHDNQGFIAPSLTWLPDNRTSVTFLNQFLRLQTGSVGGFLPMAGTLLANPNGPIPVNFQDSDPSIDDFQKKEYFSGYRLSRQLSKRWTFDQNFRWSHLGLPNYAGLYGTGFVTPAGDEALCTATPDAAPCLRLLSRSAINGNVNSSNYAVDNQFHANFVTGKFTHTLLGGYNYQYQGARIQLGYGPSPAYSPADTPGLAPNIDVFAPVYHQVIPKPGYITTNTSGTQQEHGIYLQDQVSYGKLVAVLSGREDWAPQHQYDFIAGQPLNQDASKFTGRAGLLYHANNGVSTYFSYASSFNPIPGVDAQGNAYKPDTGEQYEVGVKYQPRAINALFTASLFDVTENNVLTYDATTNTSVQAAAQRSRGIEVEGRASLANHVNLIGAVTHEQVLYTKDFYGVSDVRPVTVPENLASLWLDYDPHKHFGVGAGVRFTGNTPGTPDNSILVYSHTLFDGEAHYDLGDIRFGLNGDNLLDKTYVSYCYGSTDCNYGYKRTLYGNMTYRFDSLRHPVGRLR